MKKCAIIHLTKWPIKKKKRRIKKTFDYEYAAIYNFFYVIYKVNKCSRKKNVNAKTNFII